MRFAERVATQRRKHRSTRPRRLPEQVIALRTCIGTLKDGTDCRMPFRQIIWAGVGICELCPACVKAVESRIRDLHEETRLRGGRIGAGEGGGGV